MFRKIDYDRSSEILASVEGLRTPISINLPSTHFTLDNSGYGRVDAGYFVANAGDGTGRILPRSVATDVTGSVVTVENAAIYKVGDAVVEYTLADATITEPYDASGYTTAVGSVTAVDVVNNTITLDSATGLQNGDTIGVALQPLGLMLHSHEFSDLDDSKSLAIECTVYSEELAHFDRELKMLFPGIHRV